VPTLGASVTLVINMVEGMLAKGVYTIMESTRPGSGLGSAPTVSVTWVGGSAPPGFAFSYTASNKQLILTVTDPGPGCIDPVAVGVTGGTNCSTSGVDVGLNASQSGINYQLFRGATPVGSPVAGTGAAIISLAGNQTTAGLYTVWATNTTG